MSTTTDTQVSFLRKRPVRAAVGSILLLIASICVFIVAYEPASQYAKRWFPFIALPHGPLWKRWVPLIPLGAALLGVVSIWTAAKGKVVRIAAAIAGALLAAFWVLMTLALLLSRSTP